MAGERDKDRGPRGDTGAATSLWIDYLLLPEKLEEHLATLAGGNVSIPTPAELITVFLEQALLSQKASLGHTLPASAKDVLPVSDAWTTVTKTAALLCERAARVAVSANLTLEEIEASISSPQHQFMLLKALVKHDIPRLLIHECDLNRWMLRNALQSHPLGSAAPNATLSGPRHHYWTLGEDVANTIDTPDSGCWSVSISRNLCNGAAKDTLEEEKLAIEFLENVLSHRDGVCSKGPASACKLTSMIVQDGGDRPNGVNPEAALNTFLSTGYWCRIMLDVAEVHFMRGRIHVAHGLFTRCAELNQRISEADRSSVGADNPHLERSNNAESHRSVSSVPMQRLAGFIVACRMLLRLHPKSNVSEGRERDLNEIALKSSPLLSLGEPSAAQKMVIACERSRYNLKQNSEADKPLVRTKPEDDDLVTQPPFKKLKSFRSPDMETWTSLESQEVNAANDRSKNDDLMTSGVQIREDIAPESISEECESKKIERDTTDVETQALVREVVVGVEDSRPANGIRTLPKKKVRSIMDFKVGDEVSSVGKERDGIRLIRNVVGDTLEGHLTKGYRISLARDPGIPVSIHWQLVACNVIRDIVEGAPMQSFLQSSRVFRDNEEAVNFLMSQMAAVKKSFDELTTVSKNGTLLKPPAIERMNIRQGFERTATDVGCTMNSSNSSAFISEFALYVCCVLDKHWCWEAALRTNLISSTMVPKLFVSEHYVVRREHIPQELWVDAVQSAAISFTRTAVRAADSERFLGGHFQSRLSSGNVPANTAASPAVPSSSENDLKLEVLLCELLTAENVWDIERLVTTVHRLNAALSAKNSSDCSRAHSEVEHVKTGNHKADIKASLALDVSAVLRRRAFNALDTTKQFLVARKLYEMAITIHTRDHDSMMMLWLLDRVSLKEGALLCLPGVEDFDQGISLDLGAIEYILLSLIERELWKDLSELCEWGLSIVKKGRSTGIGTRAEGSHKGQDIWHRRCAQILKVVTVLAELMRLCSALLSSTAHNHYTEDVVRMSLKTSQLFEDFLCLLVGGDVEGSSSGMENGNQSWGAQNRKVALLLLNPSIRVVPLISQLTNPRVLMNLASLMAGWLHRCNAEKLTSVTIVVERYEALAAITCGTTFPPLGSLPHGAGSFSTFSSRVAPEFGRNLFGALLERIVELPGVVDKDKEKGHRWLQGLADLAFEEEAYVKALQLYLQAGAIKSAYYCDRSSAMTKEVFTQSVLRRMVQCCRMIGATVQAALLCQKLEDPDHEYAFRILQENSLIVVRDAVAYFDCVWEVPLLELLVHMHAKSGDHERHSALISLLQQPALNAHNPQSVRVAHVASLGQRFLQRLCEELL